MVAGFVAHRERLHARRNSTVTHHKLLGCVIEQRMAARLRFQKQCKSGIAANIDPFDRIHLDGDIQWHWYRSGFANAVDRLRWSLSRESPVRRKKSYRRSAHTTSAVKALTMWRGSLPGVTTMTSKRMAALAY